MPYETLKRNLMCKAIDKHGIDIQPCPNCTWSTSYQIIKLKGKYYLLFWFNSSDKSTRLLKTEIKKRV